jgi:uncharacterized protein YfkK (UPF0435 family)
MKFGTFLSALAKKVGIDTTQKEFMDLLAHDIEIPDGVVEPINKGLMTLEAAKTNPDIRKMLRSEALDGVDRKVKELLTEMGIEDAAEIEGEKNSYEKIALLARTVKTLEGKKAGASTNKDKEEIGKQITELNAKLKAANDSLITKEQEFKTTRDGDLTNFELQKILLRKEYSLPKEMDAELVISTAQAAINKDLSGKGFRIVRDEAGQLKIVNKDGLQAHSDNHEPLQVPDFIDGALARNKLLKVTDQGGASGANGHSSTTIQSDGKGQGNPSIVSEIENQLFK